MSERIYEWPSEFPEEGALVIRMPDRQPGPAQWDLDIEELLDEVGRKYYIRLLWMARDNQEAVVEIQADERNRRPSDVETDFSPLVDDIRAVVDSAVSSRTSVTTPRRYDMSRTWGPKARPDSWLIPMTVPKTMADTDMDELVSIIMNVEDFRDESFARDATLAYGWRQTGTGTWGVDQPTRDTFMRRTIEFVRDPDPVLQRIAVFSTASGFPGGVVARHRLVVVMMVDGGSMDAAELLETAAPCIDYGAAERHQDIESRLGYHPNRGDLNRDIYAVWSPRRLERLSEGRTDETLGARIELVQNKHLETMSRDERRKAEDVGHGRYLLQR